jgi:hypothetical protein
MFFCPTIFCSHKYDIIVNNFIFEQVKNFFKAKIQGFEIRDPRSGKNLFRIPDPGYKKAPDPGSGSATLKITSMYPACSASEIISAERKTIIVLLYVKASSRP